MKLVCVFITVASIYFVSVASFNGGIPCSCARARARARAAVRGAERDKALGHIKIFSMKTFCWMKWYFKEKRDSVIFSIIIVLSSTACQWYTWKTMCTCRNISFLNISIHYLHINNLKSWTKNVLHYAHKIGENHYKIGRRRRHANNIENKYSVLHPFPFSSTECASCKTL